MQKWSRNRQSRREATALGELFLATSDNEIYFGVDVSHCG
jgi:hypothetical protein